jgi:hypothetical protein
MRAKGGLGGNAGAAAGTVERGHGG